MQAKLPAMHGKFITFEGLDGAGKSTFIPYAQDILLRAGRQVLLTREPGGTAMGERIRNLLLDPASELSPQSEALLVFAARQQHLQTVVWPALSEGRIVLCDRFTDSTFAYQGGGRGLPVAQLEQLETWVQGDFRPDLTLLFDVDESISQSRLRKERALDRFEQEAVEFHRRVRETYRDRARWFPDRMRLIDAARPKDEVKVIVHKYISEFCL